MDLLKVLLTVLFVFFFAGCGVKGAPLPPLTPPPLGHGEAPIKEKPKKSVKKINTETNEPSSEKSQQ